MKGARFARKPFLSVVAAAFALLALLTSEIKEQVHIPQPAAADVGLEDSSAPVSDSAVAEIRFRRPAQTGPNEFTVVADITAGIDLHEVELVVLLGQDLELIDGPTGERVALAAGGRITRTYCLVRYGSGGSGSSSASRLTLRVIASEGTAEQCLDLP